MRKRIRAPRNLAAFSTRLFVLDKNCARKQYSIAFGGITHRNRVALSQPFALTIRASASNH
jgi:hypothetical protein